MGIISWLKKLLPRSKPAVVFRSEVITPREYRNSAVLQPPAQLAVRRRGQMVMATPLGLRGLHILCQFPDGPALVGSHEAADLVEFGRCWRLLGGQLYGSGGKPLLLPWECQENEGP